MFFNKKAKVKQKTVEFKTKSGKKVQKSTTKVTGKDAKALDAVAAAGGKGKLTKNQLKAIEIQNAHTERMAKHANVAAGIGQGTAMVSKLIDNYKPMNSEVREVSQVGTVTDLVNGGASPSGNTRDEDKDNEKDWVM